MCRALHPVRVVGEEGDCCLPERWGLRGEVVAREVFTGHRLIKPGPASVTGLPVSNRTAPLAFSRHCSGVLYGTCGGPGQLSAG